MTIALTKGKVALVDDPDAALVAAFSWQAVLCKGRWYARAGRREGKRMIHTYMHRLLLGLPRRRPMVDHKNGDGLDNRRENLRLATSTQNAWNMESRRGSTSRYKGVSRAKRFGWQAQISVGGRNKHLGFFHSEEDAARVYDAKAAVLFGAYARLNFPE